MTDWSDEYRARVRDFMARHGNPVQFRPRQYDWEADDEVSTYGWHDLEAMDHAGGTVRRRGTCHWVVPEGARLSERSYTMFAGTFVDADHEMGVNVTGARCACGRYPNVTLRWVGSVAEMLHDLLGLPNQVIEVEL